MFLDVSQLMQNDGAVKRIDLNVEIDNLTFNGQDIAFTTPFKLEGVLKNIAGILYLDAGAKVSYVTRCARCLDSVNKIMSFNISEAFSKSDTGDEDITVLKSGNIDLDDITEMAFVGALPINTLCSEECKGLCSECGCNLNRETCSCSQGAVDPRLAVLKNFLKD